MRHVGNQHILGSHFCTKNICTQKICKEFCHSKHSQGNNNQNDYSSFIEYYLGVILSAYKEFSSREEYIANKKLTAKERLTIILMDSITPMNKAYLMEKSPDISETTIERTLYKLLTENKIEKKSGGRFTEYKWVNKE